MKRHNVILESSIEPEDKNVLWLHGKKLKKFGKAGWEDITDTEALNQALNTLEEHSDRLENLADNEDITSVNDVLKFANKDYLPKSYSGLGRVYLRKNFVNGKNILTQDIINKPNTRYIIQYDYDLNGTEITIPEGCVLDFQGGSFSNGIINCNNSFIKRDGHKIFSDIDVYNTYNNIYNVGDYGITPNNKDNTSLLFSLFESIRKYQSRDSIYTVEFNRGEYNWTNSIFVYGIYNLILKGNNTILHNNAKSYDTYKSPTYTFVLNFPLELGGTPYDSNDIGVLISSFGTDNITVQDKSNLTKFKIGNVYKITGKAIQLGGYALNHYNFEYVKIKSIDYDKGIISFETPLIDTYNLNDFDDLDFKYYSLPRIWSGNNEKTAFIADSIHIENITFKDNEDTVAYSAFIEGAVNIVINNCKFGKLVIGECDTCIISNCSMNYIEPDKHVVNLNIYDTIIGEFAGCTGIKHLLFNNVTINKTFYAVPINAIIINSKINNNTSLEVFHLYNNFVPTKYTILNSIFSGSRENNYTFGLNGTSINIASKSNNIARFSITRDNLNIIKGSYVGFYIYDNLGNKYKVIGYSKDNNYYNVIVDTIIDENANSLIFGTLQSLYANNNEYLTDSVINSLLYTEDINIENNYTTTYLKLNIRNKPNLFSVNTIAFNAVNHKITKVEIDVKSKYKGNKNAYFYDGISESYINLKYIGRRYFDSSKQFLFNLNDIKVNTNFNSNNNNVRITLCDGTNYNNKLELDNNCADISVIYYFGNAKNVINGTANESGGNYIGKVYYNSEFNIPVYYYSSAIRTFDGYPVTINKFGTSGLRPTNIKIGFMFYDTSLNKPIWWNGTNWVDSTGTSV